MIYAIISAVFLIADYITKYFINTNIDLGATFFSIPYLVDFTYVRNTGAAFSMLSGKLPFLSFISVAFCIAVVIYWIIKKPKHPLLCTALSMMFSGALGNAIDRIFYGYVVDFIAVKFIDFPVFNIADIAITLGAVFVIIYLIFFDKDEKENG